jgi:hypothetical protein
METQRPAAMRESPQERGADEARVTVERAEIGNEQAGVPAGPLGGVRWLWLAVCLAAIVLLLFQRLGQIG